jgi:hypothetical protein
MSMRTMRTNNERTNLNLNSNIEHIDQNKTIRNKKIRTWNVQPKMQTNFYCDKTWKCKHKKNKTKLLNNIVPRISVEHTKGNGSLTFIYTFLGT